MTREEAINILNALKFILNNDQYTDEIEEALDMAIEALQQSDHIADDDKKDHYFREVTKKVDAISRKGLKENLLSEDYETHDYCFPCKEIMKRIDEQPSEHPDIIVCGDCKYWICHDRRCGYWNHGVKPLDWCCHAERRTDG